MPDYVASPIYPAAYCSHGEKEPADLVGEELGDHARIWHEYDRVARAHDQERIGNWNRGLDNLALFAGLFSAVTTAFIIQLQNDIRPDFAELTFRVLNASTAGQPFVQTAFVIDSGVRTTNRLWIASLLLSLTAALIAIMGKDWIGMYASRPACNPRQWAEIHAYRLTCVESWYMPGVIAAAPVLLHVSLILFGAGLVLFVSPDRVSQRLALVLALAAGALYCVTALSGIVFSASPFRSPATQAIRGFMATLLISLRDVTFYRPKQHAIAFLHQAAVSLAMFHDGVEIIPINSVQHGGRWRRCMRTLAAYFVTWSTPSSRHKSFWGTILLSPGVFARALCAFVRSSPSRIHSAAKRYCYLRQRPRPRPLFSSLSLYVRGAVLEKYQSLCLRIQKACMSNRWTNVRAWPTPRMLARSLSLLNEMSPTPDVLHSSLVALGDLAIGHDVGPLLSADLRDRLSEEIRTNWRMTIDLDMLSRYMLADVNLFKHRIINFYEAGPRFQAVLKDPSLRSDLRFFAVSKSMSLVQPLWAEEIDLYCPDRISQPRAVSYILPLIECREDSGMRSLVILANRFWHHLGTDGWFDLASELLRLCDSECMREYRHTSTKHFGKSGSIELLTVLLCRRPWDTRVVEETCDLILKVLRGRGTGYQPCLFHILGHDDPRLVKAIWPKIDRSLNVLYDVLRALTPSQKISIPWGHDKDLRPTGHDHAFNVSIARTAIRFLSPMRFPFVSDGMSCSIVMSEGYIWVLRGVLISLPDYAAKTELVRLMLETCVLQRASDFELCSGWEEPKPTERGILNILTAIARHLGRLLETPSTSEMGSHLVRLFAFSEATDFRGDLVSWDLGAYLREVSPRVSDGKNDPGADVSLRRLLAALEAFRPLCTVRDDLRAAWERIGLPDDTSAPSDCEIGEFFALMEQTEEISQLASPAIDEIGESTSLAGAILQGDLALLYLDASMR